MEAVTSNVHGNNDRADLAVLLTTFGSHPFRREHRRHIPIPYGDASILLDLAIRKQSEIGWDKLLLGMGSRAWKELQDYIDSNNPKLPKHSANDWMNGAIHQLLKFSLRCWKYRNEMIHGATRQEQHQIELQRAGERSNHCLICESTTIGSTVSPSYHHTFRPSFADVTSCC
mmetsp:Transcript_10007/g.14429  ORF Transcript_10007/g.14429 Transcript_10007/m.14429 type:complete len:172 (-) Transcript_10007:1056-1571(-)